MKIILTQEVTGLGSPGDVVEVKDGYGRNYLVPRGVAIRWTRGAEKTVESIKAARNTRSVRDHDHAEQIRTKLEAEPALTFTSTGAASSLPLIWSACSWSRTARLARAFLIDSTVFSPPRVHLIATPRGRR